MTSRKPHSLIISSSAFENEGNIPSKYTCEGKTLTRRYMLKKYLKARKPWQ